MPDPLSVALVCDFLEEQWPSMDLVAAALTAELQSGSRNLRAVPLRPRFRSMARRLSSTGGALNLDRLFNRFAVYPYWLRSQSLHFNVFHLIDHSYAQLIHDLPESRTVVTCHDLDTFRCLLDPESEKRSPVFRFMTQRILNGFRKAAHVVCVSESTRNQLQDARLFEPDRLTVIRNGISDTFSSQPDAEADRKADQLLGLSGNGAIVLHVGSTIPRKRIDVLLRVFAGLCQQFKDAKLVRVGGPLTAEQTSLAESLKITKKIVVLPFLETPVLAAVYRRATLALLPSQTEGFGLPAVEAMACGCPLVASDIPPLREVAGNAALFCPMGDVDVWIRETAQLFRFASSSREARARIATAGINQSAYFSWRRSADLLVDVYKQVARSATIYA